MELDDVLLHTFIYDENFGFMADPAAKDPEYKVHYGKTQIPIHVYLRDHIDEFLTFLKENKDKVETILYTSGVPAYTNLLLDKIDPKREVFQYCLYQNACYVFEKKDEDIYMMIKDVTRFRNRDLRRTLLLDPKPLNFLLAPENGIPVIEYNAEMDFPG